MTDGPRAQTLYPICTGSSVLAVKFDKGVLMVSDTTVSYGSHLRYPHIQRICPLGNKTALGYTGEHSDFQTILEQLHDIENDNFRHNDGFSYDALAYQSYLGRVLHARRNKMNPYFGKFVIAGVLNNGKSFLGQTDMYGTEFTSDFMATGLGAYYALPILRNEYEENLTEQKARELLIKGMQVIIGRDASASSEIQFVKITNEGCVTMAPEIVAPNWNVAEFKQITISRMKLGNLVY